MTYLIHLTMPWGLSPRVRGNPEPNRSDLAPFIGVYPRVCGGTFRRCHASDNRLIKSGSIPACAGEPAGE